MPTAQPCSCAHLAKLAATDANLRGQSLTDRKVNPFQVAALHADLVSSKSYRTRGAILRQFHAQQECIRQCDPLSVRLQPQADRRHVLRDEASRIDRLFLVRILEVKSHRRMRVPCAGDSE